jgi:hypothetical protein
MAGRSTPYVIGIAGAVALVLGAAWLLFAAGHAPEPPRAAPAVSAGTDAAVPRAALPAGAMAGPAGSPAPGADQAARGAPESPPVRQAAAAARPLPDEGPDAESWRRSKVAFRPRELGRLGASVKTALDAARRDMAFCLRGAAGAGSAAEDRARPPEPAILLLYLQAREGALEVVDTRTEYVGDATPEVVECCRDVLRGLEIPAFGAVPGRRYRLKFPLE